LLGFLPAIRFPSVPLFEKSVSRFTQNLAAPMALDLKLWIQGVAQTISQ
jgi:hypothetical protein